MLFWTKIKDAFHGQYISRAIKLEFFEQGGGCPDGGVGPLGGYSADLVSLVSGEGALLI